jgi:hypothetical protein
MYVSHELSHFVGKGKSEDQQYDILVNKILKPGRLIHSPDDPNRPRGVSLDLSKPISTDEAIKYQVVCFGDIPVDDLAIHVKKYSKFGLAFPKEFLIDRGVCPVFYVATETPVPAIGLIKPEQYAARVDEAVRQGQADRALYFDTSIKAIFDLVRALDGLNQDAAARYFNYPFADWAAQNDANLQSLLNLPPDQLTALKNAIGQNQQLFHTLKICTDFLCNYVFSYIKCFDAKRDIDDPANFYMEREWRLANNLKFELGDVCRIFLPWGYASRLKNDLPFYTGELTFLD